MKEQQLDIDDLLLDQGFRNWAVGIDDDETLFWIMLQNEYPQYKHTMKEARAIVRTAEANLPLIDKTKSHLMLKELKTRLGWSNDQSNMDTRSVGFSMYKVAAVLVLLIATVGVLIKVTEKESQELLVKPVEVIEKTTPGGAKLNFYLEDGTYVTMNSESEISFKSTYATDSVRHVTLKGEAYFEVAKDVSRPFVVTHGALNTTALGTAFNVRAYSDEAYQKVSLIEGKVKVSKGNSDQEIHLIPGEQLLAKEGLDWQKKEFGKRETISWRNGTIYLDQTDFEESIKKLERWYGVNIRVSNRPKGKLTCSGIFKNDNLENVLHSIAFALKFDFEINNKEVKIKFRK